MLREELRARAGAAVEASVAAHLVAAVPVGPFPPAASTPRRCCRPPRTGSPLNTYTVRFDDQSSQHDYAKLVAAAFGATHRELVLDAARISRDLPAILARLHQPSVDAVNTYYVHLLSRKPASRRCCPAPGGDEMFGGYPSFRRLPTAMRWKRRLQPIAPAMTPLVSAALPERLTHTGSISCRGTAHDRRLSDAARPVHAGELAQVAGPALRDRWDAASARLAHAKAALFEGDASSPEGDVARLETRVYLGSQLLRDSTSCRWPTGSRCACRSSITCCSMPSGPTSARILADAQ